MPGGLQLDRLSVYHFVVQARVLAATIRVPAEAAKSSSVAAFIDHSAGATTSSRKHRILWWRNKDSRSS